MAAQNRWPLVCADISSAFLQGMTFEEVSRLLGEPIREVCFDMPYGTADVLAQVPGFENVDPAIETLQMGKGGFGLKDAPRLFGIKRDLTLQEDSLRPTHADLHLWFRTDSQGQLEIVVSTRMDDLKIAGIPETIERLINLLERVFGTLTKHRGSFMHCGL